MNRPPDPFALTIHAPRDLATHNRLELGKRITEALLAGHDVILDCSQAGYLDTATIGMLLRLTREGREQMHRVTLTGLQEEQLAYFTTARLLGRLEVA